VKEFIKNRLKVLLNESEKHEYQYQKRDIGGSDVYYKKKKNDKYWVFTDKEDFDKKSNNKNTIKFKEKK
jgi:hypothetical protein